MYSELYIIYHMWYSLCCVVCILCIVSLYIVYCVYIYIYVYVYCVYCIFVFRRSDCYCGQSKGKSESTLYLLPHLLIIIGMMMPMMVRLLLLVVVVVVMMRTHALRWFCRSNSCGKASNTNRNNISIDDQQHWGYKWRKNATIIKFSFSSEPFSKLCHLDSWIQIQIIR